MTNPIHLPLDDAYKISQIVSAVGLLITSFGTLALLWITHRLSQTSKRAEILVHCNSRFENILNLCLDKAVQQEPIIFYSRFWALQFDQFTYWAHGFVSEDIFRYWMLERHEAWVSNPVFSGISYREGWEKAMAGWAYTDFIQFMKTVHEHSVDKALKEHCVKRRFLICFYHKRIC